MIKSKCLSCQYYAYVTNKSRHQVCYKCDFQDAVDDLKHTCKKAFRESLIYKIIIKLLDWLEDKFKKY